MANSEWRVANGEWRMVSSEWRMVFLEGRVPANREIFGLTTSDAAVANRQSPIAPIFGSAEPRPPTLCPPTEVGGYENEAR
jgi:hypothetical protein